MFKVGDSAYFVFQGDWETKRYNDYYCYERKYYYTYMPVKITQLSSRGCDQMKTCKTRLLFYDKSWWIPESLLIKDFSLAKFILAEMDCYKHTNRRITKEQFKSIFSNGAGSSIGRTVRS